MVKLYSSTFEQIVKNFSLKGTKQARQLVWDYINAMPTMYFVQCGNKSCSVPWIMFEEDASVAMIFTNYEQAMQTAKAFVTEGAQLRVVGLPTNAASMYVTALAAQGVECVCFNHGPQRFDAPMQEVLLALSSMNR
jgi:hypothetical protein|tara:strand:- start:5057 stop:5464 length:408 start_codon:yes stop_codon:yes gene_type:complete